MVFCSTEKWNKKDEIIGKLNKISATIINPDEIENSDEVLGKGTFANVTKGTWRNFEVAVKSISTEELYFTDELVLREISILQNIKHKNVIKLYGVYLNVTEKSYNLVMEFFDSESLQEILFTKEHKFDEKTKNLIGQQIVDAVNYLHKNLIIHRDIKPGNILISKSNVVKLIDFGCAKRISKEESLVTNKIGYRRGTEQFMPPEAILFSYGATPAFDVWSVACTLTELYSETDNWAKYYSAFGEIDMIEIFYERKFPDTTDVPKFLKNVLLSSFNYIPRKRSKINDILKEYKERKIIKLKNL